MDEDAQALFGRASLVFRLETPELVRAMKRSPAFAPFKLFFAFFGVPVPVRAHSDVILSSRNGDALRRVDFGLGLRVWEMLRFRGVRGLLR